MVSFARLWATATDWEVKNSRHAGRFKGLVVRCLGCLICGSAEPRQDRIEIFIAFAIEELLMGAERGHPSADFFAKVAETNR